MPQIVEADAPQAGIFQVRKENAVDHVFVIQGQSLRGGENQILISIIRTGLQLLNRLVFPVFLQDTQTGRCQVYGLRAPFGLGLGKTGRYLSPFAGICFPDEIPVAVPVQISPLHRQKFAYPHSRRDGHQEEGVPLGWRMFEKDADLF